MRRPPGAIERIHFEGHNEPGYGHRCWLHTFVMPSIPVPATCSSSSTMPRARSVLAIVWMAATCPSGHTTGPYPSGPPSAAATTSSHLEREVSGRSGTEVALHVPRLSRLPDTTAVDTVVVGGGG